MEEKALFLAQTDDFFASVAAWIVDRPSFSRDQPDVTVSVAMRLVIPGRSMGSAKGPKFSEISTSSTPPSSPWLRRRLQGKFRAWGHWLVEIAGSTRYADDVRDEGRATPRLTQAHVGEGVLARPIGFTRSAARRVLVAWVRWLRGPWLLWVLSLLVAFCLAVSSWILAALALVGLLAAWETAGRLASSYHEIHDDRLRRNRVRRTVAYLAALCASLAYFVVGIRLVGASVSDDKALTPALILAATAVGIWQVFRIARQGWRAGYAAFGLAAIAGVGVFTVVDDLSAPETSSMGITLVRLVAIWLIATGFMLSPPAQQHSGLWRRAGWLVPGQAVSLAYVLRPPGEVIGSWDVGMWWVAMGVFGVLAASILGLGMLGLREDAATTWRLYQAEDVANRRLPVSSIIAILFLPAVAMAPLSGWIQWSLTTAFSTMAATMVFGLLRRGATSMSNLTADPNKAPLERGILAPDQAGPSNVATR